MLLQFTAIKVTATMLIAGSILMTLSLKAQQLSNARTKTFAVKGDTVFIDSLSLIAESVFVSERESGELINREDYEINQWNSTLVWKKKPLPDSITISYRVLAFPFSKNYFHKDYNRYNKFDSISRLPIIYKPDELINPNLNSSALDYNGSFSRGITLGNNQDLVVNSSFNLQMQGKLAGDVDVLAAMSDNNIPIQPEGNTQNLQEFDKIFIQFKKNKSSLVVGDYELGKPEGYFMNFYKKLQGASFSTAYNYGKELNSKTAVSAAVAKGKYARNEFIGLEGNQGPYRLTGNAGELYIILLAGTERVYIDGQLMVRGSDRDYVIDYNSGEITFTPTRLITKDKRISVEFQYSDKAYLRSMFYVNQELHSNKWNARFNFYTEQDSKNQPVQQTLGDTQKIILAAAGDSLQYAYYSNIDSVAFTTDRPLYRKADSLGYTVYVYSTDPLNAHYDVRFSYVGSGKGNYKISGNLVNGRVYYWIAPINGITQGDYEPITPIIAPQLTQLLTTGVDYKLNKNSMITWEGALSNTDVNTFSSIGNENNAGVASNIYYSQKVLLNDNKTKPTQLFVNGQYEFAAKNFRPLERYRSVEFDRDWNLNSASLTAQNENFAKASLKLQQAEAGSIQYTLSFFNRQTDYTGLSNAVNGNYVHKGFRASAIVSFLSSKSDTVNSKYLRPSFDVSQSIKLLKGITIGLHGEQEHNSILQSQTDSLQHSSFYFNEGKIYLKSGDTAKINWNIDAASRIDYTPRGNEFKKATIGNTLNFGAAFLKNPNSTLRFTGTYRVLKITDTTLTLLKPDQSLLGRVTYDLNVKKGFLVSNTLYEIGSGQEPKIEYAYAAVADGSGTYTWIDYNDDGIQQINEFEVAAFQSDADYIKIFLPTNEYVKDFTSQFNEALSISPRNLWRTPKGFQKTVNRFSALTTFQVNKKSLKGNFLSQYNPFFLKLDDSVLISTASIVSGYLYFNKSNSKYGIDLLFQNNRSKSLLTSGVEVRTFKNYGTRIRWNISRKFSEILKFTNNQNGYASEFASQNDYLIKGFLGESQFSFQPSNVFRVSFNYNYGNSNNDFGENGETAVTNKFILDLKYNVLSKGVLNVTATFANVNFTGATNTPVEYAMLQGLQQGQNYLLNVSFDRKLSKFLEMTLSYEGRNTGIAKTVHTGQAQIRAVF
ncbi:MAG: hypothetical protein LH473_03480 [Chitinophagales bacterium]|nr:hypothetical protein [Chitinophagales bacterium]